jgi:capsular polysaccharide biosynthesis protein
MSTKLRYDEQRFTPPVEERLAARISVVDAMRRYPAVVLTPVVVLVAIAFGASVARTPSFTADSRLAVGRLDASTPSSLAGFTQATQALAERYARSVRREEVIAPAAKQLGVKRAWIRERISAAPIPETPVFRIRARAGTAEDAAALANTVSGSLVRHSEEVAAIGGPTGRGLLRRYRRAALVLARRLAAVEDRRREFRAAPSQATQDAFAEARSEATVANLQLQTLENAYRTSRQSAGSAALVEIVERAAKGRSDRARVMQLLLFIAVVAGLAIGTALALLRANRRARLPLP